MERCNELCTKEATGTCALCDALLERDHFIWWWFKGGFLRTHGIVVFLTVVSLVFLVSLVYVWRPLISAWWRQRDQPDKPITCQVVFGTLQERNSILEINLAEHHPSEPVFNGKLFFISVDPIHTGVSTVTVIRSEKKRVYGRSRHTIKTIWDNSWNALRPQVPEEFGLVQGYSVFGKGLHSKPKMS